MRREGMFGPIEVRDEGHQRVLYLNDQPQGSAYFRPSAAAVCPDLPNEDPGPISGSMYPIGWLLGAIQDPYASVLMVGLGCGVGAVQLLANFPEVDVTVIEIDPVMVQMAVDHFPLLEYYMNTGRLNIVIDDATHYLTEHTDVFDYACLDAYDGSAELLDTSLRKLCKRARHVYANVIDRLEGPSMERVCTCLAESGQPPTYVFRASMRPAPYSSMSNWIVTNDEVDIEAAYCFLPFDTIDSVNAEQAQAFWGTLLAGSYP